MYLYARTKHLSLKPPTNVFISSDVTAFYYVPINISLGAEAIKDFRTHTVNNQINGMIRHDSLGLELLPRKSAGVLPLASEKAGSGLQGWIWHRNWHRLPHR